MNFKDKYGPLALILGASEGLGAAWAHALAKHGLNLVLVARRIQPLQALADELIKAHGVKVQIICCDLADVNAVQQVATAIAHVQVNFLVYNAALSFIGPFLNNSPEDHLRLTQINVNAPMQFAQHFGNGMVERGGGGVVLMSSMAGYQGSGLLAAYAASKAFNRVLAEGLWYEWKGKGVDVIGCCPGATATPNYINTKPKPTGLISPEVQAPEAVVADCLKQLGKTPSCITGTGNRWASFFMNSLLSRKTAVNIISDTAVKMYGP